MHNIKTKNIIHIIQNDKKFLNTIIRLFENNINISNTFIIESNNIIDNSINKKNVFYKTSKELLGFELINSIQKYDILISHNFKLIFAKLVSKIHFKITIIWDAWGGDFYGAHPSLKKMLLENKTKQFIQSNLTIKQKYIHPIINFFLPMRTSYYWQKKAIKNVDFIAAVITDDYELIIKSYKTQHIKRIDFSYGNLEEDLLTGIPDYYQLGENILLGNSSTESNNHIEAIDILSDINIVDKEIITPLSYGNNNLKEFLLEYGKEKLSNNFKPLVNFIEPDKYHELLTGCGYAIFNHKRQEGVGNIIIMMYLGAKIFFNKANPTYDYFKRLGAFVFLTDEIIEKKEKAFTPLTKEQIQKNREVLIKTRSKKVVESYVQKIAEL